MRGRFRWHADRRTQDFVETDTDLHLDARSLFNWDTKLVFVGDATMSPYEIGQSGGSVEHWNEESGATWFERLTNQNAAGRA